MNLYKSFLGSTMVRTWYWFWTEGVREREISSISYWITLMMPFTKLRSTGRRQNLGEKIVSLVFISVQTSTGDCVA